VYKVTQMKHLIQRTDTIKVGSCMLKHMGKQIVCSEEHKMYTIASVIYKEHKKTNQ
jgi:hypothetical protein